MAEAMRIGTATWEKALDVLGQRAHVAQVRALKRAGVSARTAMAPAIARDMGLPVTEIREAIRVDESRIEDGHTVMLVVSGKPIPLIRWVRNQQPGIRRRGVLSAKLPPPGAGRYPNAFVARMRSGHVGVFERNDDAKARKVAGRWTTLGIHELYGPSIVHVFRKYRGVGAEAGLASLEKNLAHELEWAIQQARQAAA